MILAGTSRIRFRALGGKRNFLIMKTEYYDLNGKKLGIPVPESYCDCMTLIKSDRFRLTGKTESSFPIILRNLRPFGHHTRWLFWLRLSSYKGVFHPFCRFMYGITSRRAQVQIPPFSKIGYGLYTGHGICIIINEGTVIGNNVNISQLLNIGTNHCTPAIIGDNVYIAPHVSIVEDVKIGSNSSVGAGAVVTKDVPENATVAGVPARVLNYNHPGRYIGRRYPCE